VKYTIETLNDNGSGMKYPSKEEFMCEISAMIDDCIANGGTFFDIQVESDASCFCKVDNAPMQRGRKPYCKPTVGNANISAILVERDCYGRYERFALTPEEFGKMFPGAAEGFKGTTLKPSVHIYFEPCAVGDEAWNKFFTDMKWGLCEEDIEAGNTAMIRADFFGELRPALNVVAPQFSEELPPVEEVA
jgi:hypothetical protein